MLVYRAAPFDRLLRFLFRKRGLVIPRQGCDTPESVIRQLVTVRRVVGRISLGYRACRQLPNLPHIPEFVAGMRQQGALVAAPVMLLGIPIFVIQGAAGEYDLHEPFVVGREGGVGRRAARFDGHGERHARRKGAGSGADVALP